MSDHGVIGCASTEALSHSYHPIIPLSHCLEKDIFKAGVQTDNIKDRVAKSLASPMCGMVIGQKCQEDKVLRLLQVHSVWRSGWDIQEEEISSIKVLLAGRISPCSSSVGDTVG